MGNRKLEFEASVYFLCAFCLNLDIRLFFTKTFLTLRMLPVLHSFQKPWPEESLNLEMLDIKMKKNIHFNVS